MSKISKVLIIGSGTIIGQGSRQSDGVRFRRARKNLAQRGIRDCRAHFVRSQ